MRRIHEYTQLLYDHGRFYVSLIRVHVRLCVFVCVCVYVCMCVRARV